MFFNLELLSRKDFKVWLQSSEIFAQHYHEVQLLIILMKKIPFKAGSYSKGEMVSSLELNLKFSN